MPDPVVVEVTKIFEVAEPVPVVAPIVLPVVVPIFTAPALTTMPLNTAAPAVAAPLAVVQLIPLIVLPWMLETGLAATAKRSIPTRRPPLLVSIPVPAAEAKPIVLPLIV